MGQGAESCGAYESDYDPYDEGLLTGKWVQRDGTSIHISKMTERHLRGAIRVAENARRRANFSDDAEKWDDWVEVLSDELDSRPKTPKPIKEVKAAPKPQRGSKIELICWCNEVYTARVADLKRGWGLSCCKSHAAIKRDYGRRNPVIKETGEIFNGKL